MKWLLILYMLNGSGSLVVKAEFQTYDLCKAAHADLIKQFKAAASGWATFPTFGGCYASHMGVK